jgi:NAD(P)-dependent dehydrogenase (short-subunit alcohol dehydrogenase family)
VIADLVSLDGRSAVVTGGARGIGRAICRRLVEAGARVLVCDIDPQSLQQLEHDLGVHTTVADATDGEALAAVAAKATHFTGELSIWVNNVGAYPGTPLVEISDATWRTMIDTNLTSAFFGCRVAAQVMGPGRGGVIVNVASDLAFRAVPELVHYSAAKHAIVGLTRGVALEVAPKGIRCLAVAPGFVITEGTSDLELVRDDARRAQAEAVVPAGRFAEPDDVARVVLFAVSDLAAYMTGSVLLVEGGVLAGPMERP